MMKIGLIVFFFLILFKQIYFSFSLFSSKNFDKDGFFCTGDIVEYESNTGKLNVIDRRKNIVKLAQGEFVAPEYLENIFLQCPLIDCIFIYANIFHSSVVNLLKLSIFIKSELKVRSNCSSNDFA